MDNKRLEESRGRYHRGSDLTTYWLFSGGLVLRILIEPVATRDAGGRLSGFLAVSGIAQAAGAVLFVWAI